MYYLMLSTATKRPRRDNIQSVFQRSRVSRLADERRPHSHQFIVEEQTATGHPETTRKRGGIHRASITHRRGHCCGGVLAIGQLLVTGARRHPGGRVTRGGGRVHARVAPALRSRAGEPVRRWLALPSAAAAGPATRARPGLPPRGAASLQRRLSSPSV
ncbi:unnamed protein product [Leptosia nina]|uniref:Uncharacterized protein n=1 Tax=Leptosia nina TaxID=320188 RepID=A0AAV1JDE9_9NEOP